MKQQQTELLTLKSIRAKENKGNLYASMYDVLTDIRRNNPDVTKLLDKKLKSGELTSLTDIADFFYECFTEARIECEKLVKKL